MFRYHSIVLEDSVGTNGQIRLIESKDCEACRGFMYAQQMDGASVDYFYGEVYDDSTGTGTPTQTTATTGGPKVDLVAKTLMGKQRNAFGSYIVVNKDLQSLEFWGYEHDAAAMPNPTTEWKLLFTTDVDASVQFLGSHEFYWWPYLNFLLARLSDGSSFKFYRFAPNFQTVAANEAGAAIADKIQTTEERLW